MEKLIKSKINEDMKEVQPEELKDNLKLKLE
jgi:hypothetical protein